MKEASFYIWWQYSRVLVGHYDHRRIWEILVIQVFMDEEYFAVWRRRPYFIAAEDGREKICLLYLESCSDKIGRGGVLQTVVTYTNLISIGRIF